MHGHFRSLSTGVGFAEFDFLVLGDVGAIMGTAMLGLESGSLSNFLLTFFSPYEYGEKSLIKLEKNLII